MSSKVAVEKTGDREIQVDIKSGATTNYLQSVIVMTFWYVLSEQTYFFLNFLNFYSSFGIDHDPHVLYVHMTYVYFLFSMFLSSHDHMAKRSHYHIMIF